MGLNRFLYNKEIMIDDAGWGDLILGAVIGALKVPERRIPVSAFQSPNFENKRYLDEAVKIAKEIVEVMKPDKETYFSVCQGYILSGVRKYLRSQGFPVEEARITGELQERVERSFVNWCMEVGVPPERLESEKRFYPILEWVTEQIELRESLVKTGWKSWEAKWRRQAYKAHFERRHELS